MGWRFWASYADEKFFGPRRSPISLIAERFTLIDFFTPVPIRGFTLQPHALLESPAPGPFLARGLGFSRDPFYLSAGAIGGVLLEELGVELTMIHSWCIVTLPWARCGRVFRGNDWFAAVAILDRALKRDFLLVEGSSMRSLGRFGEH